MSVIGRLDEQVDAVLITPLKRRGEHKEETEAATHAPARNVAEPSAPKQRHVPSGDKISQHPPSEADELPVWLL